MYSNEGGGKDNDGDVDVLTSYNSGGVNQCEKKKERRGVSKRIHEERKTHEKKTK